MDIRKQCEILYNNAFGTDKQFDNELFDLFFEDVEILQKDGIVVAMYFKIPCVLNKCGDKFKAYYIYAVTTHSDFRRKGLMSQLFAQTQTEKNVFYFLKPSSEGVIKFYEQSGFKQIIGTRDATDTIIEVNDDFKRLSKLCDKPIGTYPIMIKGITNIEKLTFEYTLE